MQIRKGVSRILIFSAFLFSLSFGGVVLFPWQVNALGLTPPTIIIDSIIRNTSQFRTVYISRAIDEVGDIYIEVEAGGLHPEFFQNIPDSFTMLAGQSKVGYEVEINPGDIANGDYEGIVRFFKSIPLEKREGSGNAVRSGIGAQFLITVGGEELVEFKLLNLSADPTEVGRNAVLNYNVDNTGNVNVLFQKISLTLIDELEMEVATVDVLQESLESLQAGKPNQSFRIDPLFDVPAGEYSVKAVYYLNDEVVGELISSNKLVVYPEGTLAQGGEISGVSMNSKEYAIGAKAKIDVVFKNTGEVDVDGLLVMQLYRDEEVLDLIRGTSTFSVARGEEQIFSEIFSVPSDPGDYRIEAYVEYGNKRTENVMHVFSVTSALSALGSGVEQSQGQEINSSIFISIFGIGSIIFLLLILVIIKRRRRKNDGMVDLNISSESFNGNPHEDPNTPIIVPLLSQIAPAPPVAPAPVAPAPAPPVAPAPAPPVAPAPVAPAPAPPVAPAPAPPVAPAPVAPAPAPPEPAPTDETSRSIQ